MKLMRAVTHIRLCAVNYAKIIALDAVAAAYLALCQQYVTLFCTETEPDRYADPCYPSLLSQRWQRVAIQQAAGIATSWRANAARAAQAHRDHVAVNAEDHEEGEVPPAWKDWTPPTLKRLAIQATANVALLQPSQDTTFAYWLRVSTLEARQPLLLPVQLAPYHQRTLAGKTVNTSVTLTRKPDGWWLTLSYDEDVPTHTPLDAPVVGVDVGITHFITTSTGKHYGSFHGKLATRHQRDQAKRQRKAKLRACLKRKGVTKLPSTRNHKLARTVRQEINRAVNDLYREHPGCEIAYERLHVAGMRHKARRMNAYLYASNLAHLPQQLAWGAATRGVRATPVTSAYSSQECARCHYVARENRPNQQTFCCGVCGHSTHTYLNAAHNLVSRLGDHELQTCATRQAMKALLAQRHQGWRQHTGWP